MKTISTIRRLFLCLLCLVPICKGFSQHTCYTANDTTPLPPGTKHSCFGDAHTPKGDLHILVVFIGYNNTGAIGVPNPDWGNFNQNGYWPTGKLPSMAIDSFSIPGMNQLFNSDPSTIMAAGQEQNLSQYYYMMSNGKFRVTADIYPELVKVDYNVNDADAFLVKRDSLEKMNRYALTWIQNNHVS